MDLSACEMCLGCWPSPCCSPLDLCLPATLPGLGRGSPTTPGSRGLERLVGSWTRSDLNLCQGPRGVTVALAGWGVAVVAPEQVLWCCGVVPGLSPPQHVHPAVAEPAPGL